MLSGEFYKISHNTFFKEPFGRLLLHKQLSSFQKCCHTYSPAEYFLGLICRLVFSRFFDSRGNLRIVKEKPTRKFVSRVKRSAQLHASTKQNFARRCFFEVNGISVIFSLARELKLGRVYLKRFNYKTFIKSFIKALQKSL